jgi:hypothetical protein
MKEFNLFVWMTQLGISVAVPLALCTIGSVWLRNRFGLGPWVLVVGIGLGFYLAVDGFRTSLKAMDRMGKPNKTEQDPPPISFNDHQ